MTRRWTGPITRFLSWGCGVQSTTLAVLSALGYLEPLAAVIHADTGWERRATYQARDWYRNWLEEHDVRVEYTSAGDIRRDGAAAHIHMPFWTDHHKGGHLQRQCTKQFKIDPIKRKARQVAGFHPSDKPHPWPGQFERRYRTALGLGISLDEWKRMSDSRVKYIQHRYPLVERLMTREDCIQFLQAEGLPVPVKSACIGCPYRNAVEWLELETEEFQEAVEFDELNRHNPLARSQKETQDFASVLKSSKLYLWKGLEPLATADLVAAAQNVRSQGDQCTGAYCWT